MTTTKPARPRRYESPAGLVVHVNANGQTVVSVTHSDMYNVIQAPNVQTHQVRFVAEAPGLEAYDFTFG